MATDTVTIENLIESNHITLTATRWHENPNMDDSRDMDHWKVTLRFGRARMTIYFSKGYGHHGAEPTADEVLDCLASDAGGVENSNSFADWCGEYGYDEDSRKAEKTYKACRHNSNRLRSFLGDDLFEQLLWNTERL